MEKPSLTDLDVLDDYARALEIAPDLGITEFARDRKQHHTAISKAFTRLEVCLETLLVPRLGGRDQEGRQLLLHSWEEALLDVREKPRRASGLTRDGKIWAEYAAIARAYFSATSQLFTTSPLVTSGYGAQASRATSLPRNQELAILAERASAARHLQDMLTEGPYRSRIRAFELLDERRQARAVRMKREEFAAKEAEEKATGIKDVEAE